MLYTFWSRSKVPCVIQIPQDDAKVGSEKDFPGSLLLSITVFLQKAISDIRVSAAFTLGRGSGNMFAVSKAVEYIAMVGGRLGPGDTTGFEIVAGTFEPRITAIGFSVFET